MKKLSISVFMVFLFGNIFAQLKTPKDELRGMVKMNSEIKDFEQLEMLFSQLIEAHPEKPQGYTNLGGAKFSQGNYDGALSQFNKAIEIAPGPDLLFNRGLTKIKLQNFKGAIEDFKEVTTLLPSDHEALFNLAYAQYKADRAQDAVATLDKLLKIKPSHIHALNNRGYIYYELQKFEEAINDFSIAISSEEKDHQLFYNRALVYLKTQNNSKACKDLRAATDLGNPNATELAKEICR